jgi:N-acetylneuraminate synthase
MSTAKNSDPAGPVTIIAEAGVNHNGDLDRGLRLIDCAKEAGADAVKFQTFRPERLVAAHAPKARYQQTLGSPPESQSQMLEKLALSESDHHRLLRHCQEQGIRFLSTPFDCLSLHFLVHELGLDLIKLSSGAVTHGPLLLAAAQSGVDIILSTGLSDLGEVEQALGVLAYGLTQSSQPKEGSECGAAFGSVAGQDALIQWVTLLHCTSQYPAPFEDVNLRGMDTLKRAFGLGVGYSDHTLGISVSLAAVARGARIIEKHFTLDRTLPGPDHKASLEPGELVSMVRGIREVEAALGEDKKEIAPSELENRSVVRSSLTALAPIPEGGFFTQQNVGVKRPGTGISPIYYWSWLGKRASRDFAKDEMIE